LEEYKQQMINIQTMLQSLLRKLPSKGEIPILLEDISQQAAAYGITFELIKPEEPIDQGFYMEQPIKMTIVGKYHGFGQFAAGISQLPRIVTLHDFSIKKKRTRDKEEDPMLEMQIYAKTYWYVSKEAEQ
jgi:type IV pilus assembly protein PilO